MQNTDWLTWKRFLAKRGLISPACELLDLIQPLLPLIAQSMFLGFPLLKATPFGLTYAKLLNLLGDPDEINQFKTFLQETGA